MENLCTFFLLINHLIIWNIINAEQLTQITELKEDAYGEVIRISALFRHGHRSPVRSYPRDPHSQYPWPDGLTQLTKIGERRMYDVGKWFRKRYSKLIKKVISHTNITITSSDKDRTIMSAQCFMAGFYQPNKIQRVNKSLHWQPVPIHTIPLAYDNLIANSKDCPVWKQQNRKFYQRSKVKKIYDKYNETFAYLQKHSGLNFTKNDMLLSSDNTFYLMDTLRVQSQNNLTLPKWTKKIFPEPLLEIKNCLDYAALHLLKLRKLSAGPLLKSMTQDMIENEGKNSKRIFHFYSGHEHTITYLSTALGFSANKDPPYGSTLIFELRNKKKNHFVTIFFANSTTEAPYLLKIPKCEKMCSLSNFVSVTRHLIPKNWESECRVQNTSSYSYNSFDNIRRNLVYPQNEDDTEN